MTFAQFQGRKSFSRDEILAYARGTLLSDAPAGLPALPGFQLLPFHEVLSIVWDEAAGTGRIEAARDNALDDWYYSNHFLGDPVMPGCWGVDAVWQALRFFAAWRGLAGCGRALGMEDVSFFGQIRPLDGRVVYRVEVVSVESEGGETLLTGKGSVEVDGTPVYAIGRAQVGTSYWEPPTDPVPSAPPPVPDAPLARKVSREELAAKDRLTRAEIVALSQGALVDAPGVEIGLLPAGQMLEVGRVERIRRGDGGGGISASRANGPLEWFYAIGPAKPTALSIDAVWQLVGLFLTWSGNPGTGRALGFERVEVFGEIGPDDRDVRYEVEVLRTARAEETGDAFVRADARVFAGGRPILSVANANVGCHAGIRYSGYPVASPAARGGQVRKSA